MVQQWCYISLNPTVNQIMCVCQHLKLLSGSLTLYHMTILSYNQTFCFKSAHLWAILRSCALNPGFLFDGCSSINHDWGWRPDSWQSSPTSNSWWIPHWKTWPELGDWPQETPGEWASYESFLKLGYPNLSGWFTMVYFRETPFERDDNYRATWLRNPHPVPFLALQSFWPLESAPRGNERFFLSGPRR